ncbi:hypothetical protein [Herbiconiux sp. UC225_62]|uniref:MmyB family transcriptional regulator n=1 Tax=Herbiconiux sp. UC225_62 TaxID=3350168 RepID=UPI0036D2C6B7
MSENRESAGSLQEFVAGVSAPIVVFDKHLDVVAANEIAGAVSASFAVGVNLARFTFLNPMVEETTDDWASAAAMTASSLRASLEHYDEDQRFRELVGDLMTHSAAFAEQWAAASPTATPQSGVSVFSNPLVGVLRLAYEQLRRPVPDEYTYILWAPVDPESADRLARLQGILRSDAG